MELTYGQSLSLRLGSCTAPGALAVVAIYGRVAEESEKAVKIQTDNPKDKGCWFPRKALVLSRVDEFNCAYLDLARWFNPGGYADKWIEWNAEASTMSVDENNQVYSSR